MIRVAYFPKYFEGKNKFIQHSYNLVQLLILLFKLIVCFLIKHCKHEESKVFYFKNKSSTRLKKIFRLLNTKHKPHKIKPQTTNRILIRYLFEIRSCLRKGLVKDSTYMKIGVSMMYMVFLTI